MVEPLAPFPSLQDSSEVEHPRELDLSTDPSAIAAEDPLNQILLSDDRRQRLISQCMDILRVHDASMKSRWEREREIEKAFNLIPDEAHSGIQPDSAKLVSEITRVHTTAAAARIVGSMRSVKPFADVELVGTRVIQSEREERYQEMAGAAQDFFWTYDRDMDLERFVPRDVDRACLVGTAIKRIMWEEETRITRYRAKGNKLNERRKIEGRIRWRLVDNKDFVAWPLHEPDEQELLVAGHRSYMVEAVFRRWAKQAPGISDEDIERICQWSIGGGDEETEDDLGSEDELKDHDIQPPTHDPLKGQVKLTELWIRFPLHDEDTSPDPRYRLILHEGTETLLVLEHNPHWSGLHPYWKTPYRETDGFWCDGVGHEVLFEQAAGTALRNLLIDNLKTIAHHVRIYKLGTQAASHQGEVGPGKEFVTEDPEGDFRVVALGDSLDLIYQAEESNDARASRNSGVTDLLLGRGDPVMKTRASASGYMQLRSEAAKKFGQIDAAVRRQYSRMLMHCLHLIVQYAPDELFESILPEEKAELMKEMKDAPMLGPLDRLFRFEVKAPSAASNHEELRQNLFIIYNLSLQHVQMLLPLAQQVLGQVNPAAFLDLQKRLLTLINDLYTRIVEIHEIGVRVPDVGRDPLPVDQLVNRLLAALTQMTQMAQQAQPQPQGQPQGAPAPQGMVG